MERIGFLINKLKEQYEKAGSQDSMLVTLQMLYKELMPKMEGSPTIGNVSVVIPGLMDLSFLEKNISQKTTQELAPNTNEKQVFELAAEPAKEIQLIEKQLVVEEKPKETLPVVKPKPIEKVPITEPKTVVPQPAAISSFPKNPFVVATPKVEVQPPKAEPVFVEKPVEAAAIKPKTEIPNTANTRFMPPELKPPVKEDEINIEKITAPTPPPPSQPLPHAIPKPPVNVLPPKEVHEVINVEAKPTLNDKVEKGQPELFHTLKSAEPLKDLKKAISINERFQYINHLFMKDETMYDRSLKTINSFNVLSEAMFWIRKELATKMGWSDDDEVVQQFMALVERRFS